MMNYSTHCALAFSCISAECACSYLTWNESAGRTSALRCSVCSGLLETASVWALHRPIAAGTKVLSFRSLWQNLSVFLYPQSLVFNLMNVLKRVLKIMIRLFDCVAVCLHKRWIRASKWPPGCEGKRGSSLQKRKQLTTSLFSPRLLEGTVRIWTWGVLFTKHLYACCSGKQPHLCLWIVKQLSPSNAVQQ